ncbi:integration host factor beta subunit [Ewingella americana]
MTKSELIERLAGQHSHVPAKAIEDAVKEMLEHMAATLADGERIEIRGFGSFSLHYRAPRVWS